jgi:hypothetical protein
VLQVRERPTLTYRQFLATLAVASLVLFGLLSLIFTLAGGVKYGKLWWLNGLIAAPVTFIVYSAALWLAGLPGRRRR